MNSLRFTSGGNVAFATYQSGGAKITNPKGTASSVHLVRVVVMKTFAFDLQGDVGNIELFVQQFRHPCEDLLLSALGRIRDQMRAEHILAAGQRPDMQVVYVLDLSLIHI